MTNLKDFDYSRLDNLPKETVYRALMVLHNREQFRSYQTNQLMAQMRA